MPKLIRTTTAKLTRPEWEALRNNLVSQGKVGGSDASTLMGLNEYKSSIELYYQAIGLSKSRFKANAATEMGHQLEQVVLDNWQYWDGTEQGWLANMESGTKIKKYTKVKAIIENPRIPFMFANIDAKSVLHPLYGKKPGIVEAKTISGMAADKYESGFPVGYIIQGQHYLTVTGWKWFELAILRDGRQMNVVTFEAHRGIQNNILTACEAHYNRVHQAKKELDKNKFAPEEELLQIASVFEPSPDSTDAYNDFITERHKNKPNPNMIQGTAEHLTWAEQYKRYSKLEKRVGEHKQLYQNRIKNFMDINSANEMILGEGKKVKWYKQFNVVL
jgi:predicted phage-related endonuclease